MRDRYGWCVFLLAAGLVFVGSAFAQTPAPYAITQADPLVIVRAETAPAGTVAFLESVADNQWGRTNGTRAGFDFTGTMDGGQEWTGLVWWAGSGTTYRSAMELPGGHLGAPEVYADNPWDWARVQVFDGPIEPGPGTIGWEPPRVLLNRPPQNENPDMRAVPPARGLAALVVLDAPAPTPNESYLAKQMQGVMASCMAPMVWELSYGAQDVSSPWLSYRVDEAVHTPSNWRTDNQIYHFRGTVSGQPDTGAYVKFNNYRYDPEHSSLNYGPKRVAQDVSVENNAKTKLIKNDSDAPVDVSYDESVSETNSFAATVTHGMTMDLSVDSTQTISGGYAGVEASVSMQEHFGVSKTSEESRESSEEGTTEQSLSIEFTAEPGEYYLITISKEHAVTYQVFRIDGVADMDIEDRLGPRERRPPARAAAEQHDTRAGCGRVRAVRPRLRHQLPDDGRVLGYGVHADEGRHQLCSRPGAAPRDGQRHQPSELGVERRLHGGVAGPQRAGPSGASAGRGRAGRGAVTGGIPWLDMPRAEPAARDRWHRGGTNLRPAKSAAETPGRKRVQRASRRKNRHGKRHCKVNR